MSMEMMMMLILTCSSQVQGTAEIGGTHKDVIDSDSSSTDSNENDVMYCCERDTWPRSHRV